METKQLKEAENQLENQKEEVKNNIEDELVEEFGVLMNVAEYTYSAI
ncbi:hypothetical protein [Bacillus thuringiensis]|nr:hypothetical protein [Bacillus thuringiensis]